MGEDFFTDGGASTIGSFRNTIACKIQPPKVHMRATDGNHGVIQHRSAGMAAVTLRIFANTIIEGEFQAR